MTRTQNDPDDPPRSRPRSNTAFANAFSGWRKQRTDPAASNPPALPPAALGAPAAAALPFDALVESLSSPDVEHSLANARALVAAVSTHMPLPKLAVLDPVLAQLCDVQEAPPALRAAGYDVLAAYCERGDVRLGAAERDARIAGLARSAEWGPPEVGEARLRALRGLVRNGIEVAGAERVLVRMLVQWMGGAFECYVVEERAAERAERAASVESIAGLLASVLDTFKSEDEPAEVLDLYADLVCRALDAPPVSPVPDSGSSTQGTPTPYHTAPEHVAAPHSASAMLRPPYPLLRTAPSSPSLRSLGNAGGAPTKEPPEVAVTLYLNHLSSQLKVLAPRYLKSILPILFRAQAFFASPLSRLTVTGQAPAALPIERKIQKRLLSLFSGPDAPSCMNVLKSHLSPPHGPVEDLHALAVVAFGAHRVLRNLIRQRLTARMARAYISRVSAEQSTHSGAPGGKMDIGDELMHRAWTRDEIEGWDEVRFGKLLWRSVEEWLRFQPQEEAAHNFEMDRERIVEEAAGTLQDILQEFDERENVRQMGEDEATIAGQTLRNLASYVQLLSTLDDTPYILPIAQPSAAQKPILRTFSAVLSRDHSIRLNPPLSTTMLFVADHLTDADCAKVPPIMLEQSDLSPISPKWLQQWQDILGNATFSSGTHPQTWAAIVQALQTVYDSLHEASEDRMRLAELVFNFCQKRYHEVPEDPLDGRVLWRILGDEVVFLTVEKYAKDPEDADAPASAQDIIELLADVAVESSPDEEEEVEPPPSAHWNHSTSTSDTASPQSYSSSTGTSTASSPVLSRHHSQFRPVLKEKDSAMPSVMSILSSLTGSRSQSAPHPEEEIETPVEIAPPIPPPEPPLPRPALAMIALISVFGHLAFSAHSQDRDHGTAANQIYELLVQLLVDSRSARAKLTLLQFLMRLRATQSHQMYFVEKHPDVDGHVRTLASLIGRVPPPPPPPPPPGHEESKSHSAEPSDEVGLLRTRTRGAAERDGRRASRGRGRPSNSASSRSRSRAPMPLSPPVSGTPVTKVRRTMWTVPETCRFPVLSDTPSSSLVSYDPEGETPCVSATDLYLDALLTVLQRERNWEIVSYVLCHLPVHLGNKHFFCGPRSKVIMTKLATFLSTGVVSGELGTNIDRWPPGLKARDAHGLVFHSLTVLVSYKICFETPLRHALVDVFREGLNGTPSTIICCLHALTLCAYELTASLKKSLPAILETLSQIMSNPDMAVHILNFLSIVGSLADLQTNLREDDVKMVFGVALQYLQHHNRLGDHPTISWALSQYVRMICFYVVYIWFLSVKPPDRPRHIPYIARQLLLANEGRRTVDEPTEVCFDWLARYLYVSAEPKPKPEGAVLEDMVMNPSALRAPAEPSVSETTWLIGNSVMTVRTLEREGWVEVLSRRPSGFTKFTCRLEKPPAEEDEEGNEEQSDTILEDGEGEQSETEPQAEPEAEGTEPSDVTPEQEPDAEKKDPVPPLNPSYFALQLSPHPATFNFPSQGVIEPSTLRRFIGNLDRVPVIDTHKVGIMYVAPGQTTEQEILRNTSGSSAYTTFLSGMGRLINLRSPTDVYTGGLDPDEDGEYAYAWGDDIGQILYHTATMMPSREGDEHCVNKKRHIGNDYVRIVWNDSGEPYRFDTLATQFQFVNIVIEPHTLRSDSPLSESVEEAGGDVEVGVEGEGVAKAEPESAVEADPEANDAETDGDAEPEPEPIADVEPEAEEEAVVETESEPVGDAGLESAPEADLEEVVDEGADADDEAEEIAPDSTAEQEADIETEPEAQEASEVEETDAGTLVAEVETETGETEAATEDEAELSTTPSPTPPPPIPLPPPTLGPGELAHQREYFKVSVQQAPGMREFTPIGDFKLISDEQLPLLVRQLSMLADWFAGVFMRTERDTVAVEAITNWRNRLQMIARFRRNNMPEEEAALIGRTGADGEGGEGGDEGGGEGMGMLGLEVYRNFAELYD
ncbi:hypothetical protein CONPUDRAFT_110361 [Coniophora puteana RWD-64-598 SS2]|uniref:Rap-GAP domain-containing protein n=1 Tax=Coniophora puteana (strain RWD-64-598) TaxID=741705 RepID=A0A5M3MCD4_CONPW|nr:uncharacterized protein CONPUDRAFT_110361 [Coniophora puteana RWD-64-598 SS2]EIW76707.1 hypothetical protein CONPUDRAFT_110361 [Coniophora puteana RWD-64-598 SS2]